MWSSDRKMGKEMGSAGFVESGLPFKSVLKRGRAAACDGIIMGTPMLSRRRLGKLALGISGALITNWQPTGQAVAASGKQSPTFITDESGIRYYDVKTGTGTGPVEGDFVVVDYMAFLSNGKVFDSRKGIVFQIGKRQVIPGLERALYTMRPGGERKVVIPPSLAYGDKGVCLNGQTKECLVPPGETLGFSVTLLRVALPPT